MTKSLNYSYGHIWRVAYPILVSLIMEQLLGMTDTAFLGRVGEVELAASAIAGVYCLAIFVTGFGFGIGSQIIIARRNGEGNYRETGNIFWHGVYFLTGLAAVVIILSELFSPWILGHLIESDEIVAAAMSYVRWRLVGFIFAFVTVMFRAFYVGTTQTRTLTLNSIVMVLANILFNWILVFGKLGFPALGIAGSAIGTALAELVSLIFFTVYTITAELFLRVHMVHLLHVRGTPRRKVTCHLQPHPQHIGLPLGIRISFRLHMQFARQQPHRGRPHRFCPEADTQGHKACIYPRDSTGPHLRPIPENRDRHIHRHAGPDFRIGPVAVGTLFLLSVHCTCTHMLQCHIRYWKHPHRICP